MTTISKMILHFLIGDRVRVTSAISLARNSYVGQSGKVTEIRARMTERGGYRKGSTTRLSSWGPPDYYITFDDGRVLHFDRTELEKADTDA